MKKVDLLARNNLSVLLLNQMAEDLDGEVSLEDKYGIKRVEGTMEVPVDVEVVVKVNGIEVDISQQIEEYIDNIISNLDEVVKKKAEGLVRDKIYELADIANSIYNVADSLNLEI